MLLQVYVLETMAEVYLIQTSLGFCILEVFIGGCSTTFKTFSAFSSHLNRKHPTTSTMSPENNQFTCCIVICNHELEDLSSKNDLPDTSPMLDTSELQSNGSVCLARGSKRMAAFHLQTLKEKHRQTQSSINFAVTQVTYMFKLIFADIKSSVEEKLSW